MLCLLVRLDIPPFPWLEAANCDLHLEPGEENLTAVVDQHNCECCAVKVCWPKSGVPKSGVPKSGVPKSGVPKSGVLSIARHT